MSGAGLLKMGARNVGMMPGVPVRRAESCRPGRPPRVRQQGRADIINRVAAAINAFCCGLGTSRSVEHILHSNFPLVSFLRVNNGQQHRLVRLLPRLGLLLLQGRAAILLTLSSLGPWKGAFSSGPGGLPPTDQLS